jgi:hypothetical protein
MNDDGIRVDAFRAEAAPGGASVMEAWLGRLIKRRNRYPGAWRVARLIDEAELFGFAPPHIVDVQATGLRVSEWPAQKVILEWHGCQGDSVDGDFSGDGAEKVPSQNGQIEDHKQTRKDQIGDDESGTAESQSHATDNSPERPGRGPSGDGEGSSDDSQSSSGDGEGSSGSTVPAVRLPADLSDDDLLDSIVAAGAAISREQADQFVRVSELAHRRAGTAVTELTGRPAHGEQAVSIGAQAVADELGLTLTLSRWNAEKLVFTAVGLCLEAPEVLDCLTRGEIDLPRAEVILDYTHSLLAASTNDDPDGADPEQLARDLQEKLLTAAKDKTTSELKKTAEDALIRINPAAAERRHAAKRTRRHLRLIPDLDGMCWLSVYLPADQGVRIMAALKALVEAAWNESDNGKDGDNGSDNGGDSDNGADGDNGGDTRTLDQASVDALYDIVIAALETFGGSDVEHHCTHPDHHHDHATSTTQPGVVPDDEPANSGTTSDERDTSSDERHTASQDSSAASQHSAAPSQHSAATSSDSGAASDDRDTDPQAPGSDSNGLSRDSADPRRDSADPRCDSADPRRDSSDPRCDSCDPRCDSADADTSDPGARSCDLDADPHGPDCGAGYPEITANTGNASLNDAGRQAQPVDRPDRHRSLKSKPPATSQGATLFQGGTMSPTESVPSEPPSLASPSPASPSPASPSPASPSLESPGSESSLLESSLLESPLHDEKPPAAKANTPGTPAVSRSRTRRPKADTQVLLTISADTLTGASDDPAYLNGYGPIIASLARKVAATGTWRCALINGIHGTLEGLGTSTYTPEYTPTAPLRRHLIARDTHCRWPGCTRPARRCHVDHVVPYSKGGATCDCNTEILCAHHHRIKHETGFTVHFSTNPEHPPGTIVFTTPAGRQHLSYPEPLQAPCAQTPCAQTPCAENGPGTESNTTRLHDAAHEKKDERPSSSDRPPPESGPPPF